MGVHAQVLTQAHIYMCTHMHTHTYMSVHVHTHMHTHVSAHRCPWGQEGQLQEPGIQGVDRQPLFAVTPGAIKQRSDAGTLGSLWGGGG